MNTIQKLFDSIVVENISFKKIGASIIEKKLSGLGIILTEDQRIKLESNLENLEIDSLKIDLEDEQIINSTISLDEAKEKGIQLDLEDSLKDIDKLIERISESFAGFVPEAVDKIADEILDELKATAPSMLQEHKEIQETFETTLRRVWGKSLDLLQMFIVISLESGGEFNNEFRATAASSQDYVFDALTRLHARACHVASEIHTLLSSGYADGAHARWRALHEIAVVGLFIKDRGQLIAERYLLHEGIESYKAAILYQQHVDRLGYDPLTQEELTHIEQIYQQLKDRFGTPYKNSYGWASIAIGKDNPTFSDIELAVNLDHLRPFYKLASHNVHANPKGVFFKLGLFPTDENVMLVGPSNLGLADPGHGTAISLQQISVALLTHQPNLDTLVVCNILTKLEQEIGDEFLKAHQFIEQEGGVY